MSLKTALENVKLAELQVPKAVATPDTYKQHPGLTEDDWQQLGVTKSDLKRLERAGFAKRGRTKNYWGPGEELPTGKIIGEGIQYRGTGSKVRWVIING